MRVRARGQSIGSGRSQWGAVAVAAVLGASALAGTLVLPGAAGAAPAPTTVTTTHTKTWGTILTTGNGTTVYRLTTDPKNKSVCSGTCAKIWPPVVLAAGQKAPIGHSVSGLGTITRPNGTHQVTYKGVPLYKFVGDHKPGQATGNVKDTWGRWWVVNPANPRVAPTAVQAPTSTTPTTVAGSGAAY